MERNGKLSYEALVVILITILGWATSAGMMWQHITDMDARLIRVEQKIDTVIRFDRSTDK